MFSSKDSELRWVLCFFVLYAATAQVVAQTPTTNVNVAGLTNTAPPTIFQPAVVTFAFNVVAQNIGPGAIASGSDNFAVTFQLSDVDMRTSTDTLAIPVFTPGAAPSNLAAAIPAGSAVTLSGTVDITVPAAKCLLVNYLCVHVDSSGTYTESDTTNNVKCLSISAEITCAPDVIISTASDGGSATYDEAVAVTATFSISIKNNAAAVGTRNNIAATAAAYVEITAQMSNVDLSTGGSSNTLTDPQVTAALTLNPVAKTALAAGATQVVTTPITFTVGNVDCPNVM